MGRQGGGLRSGDDGGELQGARCQQLLMHAIEVTSSTPQTSREGNSLIR